jgi:hypothetical protein
LQNRTLLVIRIPHHFFRGSSLLTKELISPEYKEEINYNEEFWKKYLKNEINFAIIKDLSEKLAELDRQVKEVEVFPPTRRASVRSTRNSTRSKTARRIGAWQWRSRRASNVPTNAATECMDLTCR